MAVLHYSAWYVSIYFWSQILFCVHSASMHEPIANVEWQGFVCVSVSDVVPEQQGAFGEANGPENFEATPRLV